MVDHAAFLRKGREEVHKRNKRRSEEALVEILAGVPVQIAHILRQVTKIGVWLTVQPSKVNSIELGA